MSYLVRVSKQFGEFTYAKCPTLDSARLVMLKAHQDHPNQFIRVYQMILETCPQTYNSNFKNHRPVMGVIIDSETIFPVNCIKGGRPKSLSPLTVMYGRKDKTFTKNWNKKKSVGFSDMTGISSRFQKD